MGRSPREFPSSKENLHSYSRLDSVEKLIRFLFHPQCTTLQFFLSLYSKPKPFKEVFCLLVQRLELMGFACKNEMGL